jgi:hypothetical protein
MINASRTIIFSYRTRGRSTKSARGWSFVAGNDDHNQKLVFEDYLRLYNHFFLVCPEKKLKNHSFGGAGRRLTELIDPPLLQTITETIKSPSQSQYEILQLPTMKRQ